jgi:hypothetical protein
MNPITGMPLNIVNPPPLGAKSSSPMDVANAHIAASNAKMSSLLNVSGGGKHNRKHNRKYNTFKGGAAAPIVVQPLHVPYPGGDALQGINTQMTSIGAQNVANSEYDTTWVKTGGKRSESKRSESKRSGSKRSESKRSESKRSGSKRSESKRSESKRSGSKRSESKRSYKRTNKRRRTNKRSTRRYRKCKK